MELQQGGGEKNRREKGRKKNGGFHWTVLTNLEHFFMDRNKDVG